MTITEFLLARIDEDEGDARDADEARLWRVSQAGERIINDAGHMQRFMPSRMIAECEAKRAIVELSRPRHYTNADDSWYSCGAAQLGIDTDNPDALSGGDDDCTCGFSGTTPILKALAVVYADHPDYDEAWRM